MNWLDHLKRSWEKQATEINSPAPNYQPSRDPNHVCDNCAFQDRRQSYCRKYSFKDEPAYVCDSWQPVDLGLENLKLGSMMPTQQPINQTLSTIKPMGLADGSRPKPGLPPQHPAAPAMPQNLRRPSVVAQIGREQGGANAVMANVRDMFNPQMPQKQANVLNQLFINLLKQSARHAIGDPVPHDWNATVVKPDKKNGGIPSHGQEAWDSAQHYRHRSANKDNFHDSWHLKR